MIVGVVVAGFGLLHAADTPSINAGVFTSEQVERGAEAYAARCASCHAVDLRGNSNSPSLLGVSFLFLWEGRSLGELFTALRTQMPAEQPGSLSSQTYLDILAFMLDANGYPAGTQSLTDNQAVLDSLIIAAPTAR